MSWRTEKQEMSMLVAGNVDVIMKRYAAQRR